MGKAIQLDHLPKFDSIEGPRFFGGSDFMQRERGTWGDFPETAYFLPSSKLRKGAMGPFFA